MTNYRAIHVYKNAAKIGLPVLSTGINKNCNGRSEWFLLVQHDEMLTYRMYCGVILHGLQSSDID